MCAAQTYLGGYMDYGIGATACYIQDHQFKYLCTISKAAAVQLVKDACPNAIVGNVKAKELTCDGHNDTDAACNGWLNKLFVIIDNCDGKWLAVNNHDGRFSLYLSGGGRV